MKKSQIFLVVGISFLILLLLFITIPYFLLFCKTCNNYLDHLIPWVYSAILITMVSLIGTIALLSFQSEKHRFETERWESERNSKEIDNDLLKKRIDNAREIQKTMKSLDDYNASVKELTSSIKEVKNNQTKLTFHQIQEIENVLEETNKSFDDLKNKFKEL